MATKIIEEEVVKALDCINKGKNFILTGGAGSGKTYSLVSLIKEVGLKYPDYSIVCITYTNNAVFEIRNRISNDNLHVSTIHKFLWNLISNFQKEIKMIMVELINSQEPEYKIFYEPLDLSAKDPITLDYFNNSDIRYDEYYSLRSDKNSTISHDHILIIAEKMFDKYPKISSILKDTGNCIFVDEYQDTNPSVIKILLEHLNKSKKKNVVGFFGDPMQAIYETGIGDLSPYNLERIVKKENRRNPESIIKLANKLRTDFLQVPSYSTNAPNIVNNELVAGSATFIHTDNLEKIDKIRELETFNTWNFSDSASTKELWLVNKANAKRANFKRLFEVYKSDEIDKLIKFLDSEIKKKIDFKTKDKQFQDIVNEFKSLKIIEKCINNIDGSEDYSHAYGAIKNKQWEEVRTFKIVSDSILSYKYDLSTEEIEESSQRDPILKHLDGIYELLELYKDKKINEFLKKINYKIKSLNDKQMIYNYIQEFLVEENTIECVVNLASKYFNVRDDIFSQFIDNQGFYLWLRIKEMPFSEYENSIKYQRSYLPFATQHSIKGSEFDNVMVVLDNGNWKIYNFEMLLKSFGSNGSVLERTKKLFYVSCTRAKRNLVVLMETTDTEIIQNAKELFGTANVIKY